MKKLKFLNIFIFICLFALSLVFLIPVITVLSNSFKDKFSISQSPFVLPDSTTFSGVENYINGIADTGFVSAFFWSLFITVSSVAIIVLFTSMTAWYIIRVKSRFNIVQMSRLVSGGSIWWRRERNGIYPFACAYGIQFVGWFQ